jgi:phosphoenolpyruvate carboxylase
VQVFGFHLAPIDLRQNSEIHARSVAELLAGAGRCPDYEGLSEAERIKLLVEEISTPRPLYSPYLSYSEETRGELAIFFAARELRASATAPPPCPTASSRRPTAFPTSSNSPCCSRNPACCCPGANTPHLDVNIIPLFETIEDLQKSAAPWMAFSSCRPTAN